MTATLTELLHESARTRPERVAAGEAAGQRVAMYQALAAYREFGSREDEAARLRPQAAEQDR